MYSEPGVPKNKKEENSQHWTLHCIDGILADDNNRLACLHSEDVVVVDNQKQHTNSHISLHNVKPTGNWALQQGVNAAVCAWII